MLYSRLESLDCEVSKLVDAIISRLGGENKLPMLIHQEIEYLTDQTEHESGTQQGRCFHY